MENPEIDRQRLNQISPQQAWHYGIVPKKGPEGVVSYFCAEIKPDMVEELELITGLPVRLVEISKEELNQLLIQCYPVRNQKKNQIDGDYSNFLPNLIYEARTLKSSDIHIEIYDKHCRVRYRVDGKLAERYRFSREKYPALVNRIKIQANLDIAEKRLPQDGRIIYKDEKIDTDIRVSVLPTLHGEKVVLRLLSKDTGNVNLASLGFNEKQLAHYLNAIKKPHGIILISGPTGSGKTTTLYASLKLLNQENVNILTVEDPIEYTLEGINQVQVKEDIGLSFASALRTFLRQDPDIIMLGEIRDRESAQMAIRAALTGHLVFSTIHTNSAFGTISRLLDMDIPPYLLAGTLVLSMAQRLVRLLCPQCKVEEKFDPSLLPPGIPRSKAPHQHFLPNGCEHCFFTGYSGRKAVYELIPIESEIAEKIKHNQLSRENLNIETLQDCALKLFVSGNTSLDEINSYLV